MDFNPQEILFSAEHIFFILHALNVGGGLYPFVMNKWGRGGGIRLP